jgi:hypothetical protein
LLYWAFCCPSKLQNRVNDWMPLRINRSIFLVEEDIQQSNTPISWIFFHPRFIKQYMLLSLCFTAPTTLLVSWHEQPLNLMILAFILMMISYFVGRLNIAHGIIMPLVFSLMFIVKKTEFNIIKEYKYTHIFSILSLPKIYLFSIFLIILFSFWYATLLHDLNLKIATYTGIQPIVSIRLISLLETTSAFIIMLFLMIFVLNIPIVYYFTGIENECRVSASNCFSFQSNFFIYLSSMVFFYFRFLCLFIMILF